jgi:hypothetical protein
MKYKVLKNGVAYLNASGQMAVAKEGNEIRMERRSDVTFALANGSIEPLDPTERAPRIMTTKEVDPQDINEFNIGDYVGFKKAGQELCGEITKITDRVVYVNVGVEDEIKTVKVKIRDTVLEKLS